MSEVAMVLRKIDDDVAFCEFLNDIENAFIGAIQRLDIEQQFGSPKERAGIVLNLLMGDQSDEDRLRIAALVNPPAIVDRFRDELASVTYD
jgi:hypothetical protein